MVVLPLPRLDFKAGQQRCQLREMDIFPPTLRASVFQLGFPFARLATGNDFEVALSAERHSGSSSAQVAVRTCCLVLMLLVSAKVALQWEGPKGLAWFLSQCLSLGVFSFSNCFGVKTPTWGAVDRMLRLRQQFSHPMFRAAVLSTAITPRSTAGGCLQPAQHLGRSGWGSLRAVHSRSCGTRVSPEPFWVSLGVSRAEPLLSDAVTGEVRDLWKCLSCKVIPRNV